MSVAAGAARLSECGIKEGAVLVREQKIMSYGYNRDIIPGKEWNLSAISDALMGSKENDISNCTIFCTRFPKIEDMMLIVATGIKTLYFLGDITDQAVVRFMKEINSIHNCLEVVRLQ